MLISYKRFTDQIRQWFNKCAVYHKGSSGIKKSHMKQFAKACLIKGVLYQNIDQPRE